MNSFKCDFFLCSGEVADCNQPPLLQVCGRTYNGCETCKKGEKGKKSYCINMAGSVEDDPLPALKHILE